MSLDCDGFAAELADYLEGDAPPAVCDALEAHAAECAACRQLLEDLSTIRHDASTLPVLAPSRDLWDGIAERIDARVIPLESPVRTIQPMRRSWARPAIAAAALIVVTAGITHVLTRASLTAPTKVASATPPSTQQVATTPTPVTSAGAEPSSQTPIAQQRARGGTSAIESTLTNGGRTNGTQARLARNTGRPARLADAEPLMNETQPVYDREIDKLHRIVKTRRAQLDPKTIAVLEQSIAVIDSAIAQSRAALARDPASGFLATQLNHSLEKKVELLRTAALLPART
jgi:hypothetical protein